MVTNDDDFLNDDIIEDTDTPLEEDDLEDDYFLNIEEKENRDENDFLNFSH